MRKRNVEFHFMLTDAEASLLQTKAKKCGLSQQAFMRSLLYNTPIKEQPSIDFHTTIKSLEKIGDNINQIAAKANTRGFVDKVQYRKEIDKLERVIAELMRAVYS